MTDFQKLIKYLAIGFAVFLSVSIIGGILSAVGLLSGLFGERELLEDAKEYKISSEITDMEIFLSAADFSVKEGEEFFVESNVKDLSVQEKNGKLVIREKNRFFGSFKGTLVLTLPKDQVFRRVEMEGGAGVLEIEALSVKSLHLELGAGDLKIHHLTAEREAEIEGGAGRITVSDGTLHNLDLNMGVGQLNLTARLLGNCDLELGVGETNLTLLGKEEDYSVSLEKGVGSITVKGESVSSYGTKEGKNRIEIEGGVGTVDLSYQE